MNKDKMLGLAAATLNVLDAVFTLTCINLGLANEANPLMAFLINKSQLLFLAVKFLLTPVIYISIKGSTGGRLGYI